MTGFSSIVARWDLDGTLVASNGNRLLACDERRQESSKLFGEQDADAVSR